MTDFFEKLKKGMDEKEVLEEPIVKEKPKTQDLHFSKFFIFFHADCFSISGRVQAPLLLKTNPIL